MTHTQLSWNREVDQKQYHVRAVVRRQGAIDSISKGPSVQTFLATGALTFALVPDLTKPNAYHEAVKGCTYIIHSASPLPTTPGDLIASAVAGTQAILQAAEDTPSVKRVVITSSCAALRVYERRFPSHPANQAILSGRADEVPMTTAETTVPNQPPLPEDAAAFHRYDNSKIAAHNLVQKYAADHPSSHFSIISLAPGYVLGPEELTESKAEAFKGSNFTLGWLFEEMNIAPLMGGEDVAPLAEFVHLQDVVDCHVKALDVKKLPDHYRNFLLCSDGPTGPVIMDAVEIVKKGLPTEVAEGKIPFAGRFGKSSRN